MSHNEPPAQSTPPHGFPSRALVVFALSAALLGLLDSRRLSGFLERLDLPGSQHGATLVRDAALMTGATLVSDAESRLLHQLTPNLTLGGNTPEAATPEDNQSKIEAAVPRSNATLATDDTIVESIQPIPAEPTIPVAPVQSEKPRVLIVGDSLIMEGLGPTLLRTLRKNTNLHIVREGRYSTGLTRTDTFDWPQHLTTLIPEKQPDLVVVCLGANDFQDILSDGKRHIAGSASWNPLYRARADAFLAEATRLGAQVVWLGLPIMGSETYEERIRGIADIQQAACDAIAPMCLFVNNLHVLADKQGNYLSHMVDGSGKHVRLRYKDKIHVTEPAGQMLTDNALPLINKLLQPKIEAFTAYQSELVNQSEPTKQTVPTKQDEPMKQTDSQQEQPAQLPHAQ